LRYSGVDPRHMAGTATGRGRPGYPRGHIARPDGPRWSEDVRGTGAGKVRVKTAKGRTAQSTRWLERQLNDPYVRRAKAEGWRSRAAFKLIELDEKFHFVKGSRAVVDL